MSLLHRALIWKIYLDNFSGSVFICWPQHLCEHENQHLTDDKRRASWVETVLRKLLVRVKKPGFRTEPGAFLPLRTNAGYGITASDASHTANSFVGNNPHVATFTHPTFPRHQVRLGHQGGMLN